MQRLIPESMAVIEFLPSVPLTGPFLATLVSVMVVDTVQLTQVPVSSEQYPVLPEAAADESFGTACGIGCSYPAVKADVISYFCCTPGPSQLAHDGYLFAATCRSIWRQKLC